MLTQLDIDELQKQIQAGQTPELYYVANFMEFREQYIDEEKYKSVSEFKIVKIKISKIFNAYIEYLYYINHMDSYHVESDEVYYELDKKYIHNYTVKTDDPKMPSVIYGFTRQTTDDNQNIITYHDDTPIEPDYTNTLEYGNTPKTEVLTKYQANKKYLNWKYIELELPEKVDGINFKYITSDWYVIECDNFPRTEHIIINTKCKNAYFRDLKDAFKYKEQLEA